MILTAITPTRNFNTLYIILDSLFIVVLIGLLIWKKRYVTLWWSLAGGILYFIVDFGYFYLLSKSRTITINNVEANSLMTALVLLWMSLSYGITNFAYIWLCLKKDKDLKYWLLLIVGWWLVCPVIATLGGEASIKTYRTTGAYHGFMALILVVGYLLLIMRDLNTIKEKRSPILTLNLIGISVQFAWEFALLLHGIRPFNEASIMTLLVDSLIETNLGMPYIYLIFCFVHKRINDDLTLVSEKKE